MLDIIIYALGVMYTPGPVNAICLNSGIQKQSSIFGFSLGVSIAMFALFGTVSLIGEALMNDAFLRWTAILGAIYILWLAYKIFFSRVGKVESEPSQSMSLQDGLMLQLLNPKGITVALPIATVQFPSAGITGGYIYVWCAILALLAFGAPTAYYIAGRLIGKKINETNYLAVMNKLMAVLLLFVGLKMGVPPVIDLVF
ncbi:MULTISPECIES: LysE family translocator [Gammaproteobacteria]|nr:MULTISPECIES: LysE family transporter [Gammaproteobacteria]MBO0235444.1 LysE family transporter [Vibrio parahaemolyticus]MCK7657730.1 LysE family transporter [Shewanella sp. JNE4-2]MDF0532713.1 LysE family transporter [Shewanella sp. A32]MDF4960580.1 LysE family transporter [Vibrio parahaemolyticus]MDF5218380.1 LysE family transporter [Vibrio parahaemolyticus]